MTVTLTPQTIGKQLIAAGNDGIWYGGSDVSGTLTELTAANGTIDTSDQLVMFEAFQKAIILNGANKKLLDLTSVKLTTGNIGSNPPDFGTVLTGGTSGAIGVVDRIGSLTGATTVKVRRTTAAPFQSAETVTGVDDDGNSVSFSLTASEIAAPHYSDFTVWGGSSTFGTLPTKAYLGCMWLGRMFLAGDPAHPSQWYASRQGNIYDWLYDQEDVQSACTGGDVELGVIQDAIMSLIPCGNDYLIFGCFNSLNAMIGDPMQGGSMKKLASNIGMFGAKSWCFDESGNLFFVGPGGIYKLPDGLAGVYRQSEGVSMIQNLTEMSLPRLIQEEAVDPSTHRITMEFDSKRHGLLIAMTTIATRANSCYWFDLRTGGFTKEQYPVSCAPYSMVYYPAATVANKDMLIGCSDGYVRRFDDDQTDDNIGATTQAIDGRVTFGPFQLGEGLGEEGKVGPVYGVMGGLGCSNVTYYVFVGDSPEAVMDKVTAGTYDLTGIVLAVGFQRGGRQRRTVRGKYAAIQLRNDTLSQTWAMEEIEIEITPVGRLA